MKKDDAEELKKKLEAIGCTIKLAWVFYIIYNKNIWY